MLNLTVTYPQYHKNNIIVSRLKAILFWKVKNSYMFRLAKVAIIKLHIKKIKRKIYSCN